MQLRSSLHFAYGLTCNGFSTLDIRESEGCVLVIRASPLELRRVGSVAVVGVANPRAHARARHRTDLQNDKVCVAFKISLHI